MIGRADRAGGAGSGADAIPVGAGTKLSGPNGWRTPDRPTAPVNPTTGECHSIVIVPMLLSLGSVLGLPAVSVDLSTRVRT